MPRKKKADDAAITPKYVVWEMDGQEDTTPPYPPEKARRRAKGFMLSCTWVICRDCLAAMRVGGPQFFSEFMESQGWYFKEDGWYCPKCCGDPVSEYQDFGQRLESIKHIDMGRQP